MGGEPACDAIPESGLSWARGKPMSRSPTARVLEQLAGELHSAAFDFEMPARSIAYAEQRIARVERICADVRAAVRGRAG